MITCVFSPKNVYKVPKTFFRKPVDDLYNYFFTYLYPVCSNPISSMSKSSPNPDNAIKRAVCMSVKSKNSAADERTSL